jgi:hypothetical protein
VLGIGNLGAGRTARFSYFQRHSVLHGGRFVLRCSAADAVTLGMAHLVAEGFLARDDNLEEHLRTMGSPWTAQAVEIGDPKGSRREGVVDFLIDETPLEVFMQRRISHTLVMVTARELPDATTELVIYPHASSAGDPQWSAGAEARLRKSYTALAAASTANGTLVSHERFLGIRNDGSPASQEMVGTLLGWR